MFGAHTVGAKKVLEYYRGSLVYSDVSRQQQLKKTYAEGATQVTVDRF